MRTSSLLVVAVSFVVAGGVTMSSTDLPEPLPQSVGEATRAVPAPQTGGSTTAPAGVVHIPASKVDAVFAKGGVLLETAQYQIHAARRGDPGPAEVHAANTDIFYVLEGSATVVTGGTVVGATMPTPGETRGTEVQGGESRTITQGDVLVIPAGTAHQLQAVHGTLRYLVVKVTRTER